MERPVRFIHAADLHLGDAFIAADVKNADLGTRLRMAIDTALDRIISLALSEQVDFVLFAGDVFDGSANNYGAQARFVAAMRRLESAHIPVYYACGNHDPFIADTRLSLPGNVMLFPTERPETYYFKREGVQPTALVGCSYASRSQTQDLAALYQVPSDPDTCNTIAVLHTNLGSATAGDTYAPTSLDTLIRKGFDYWALGHIHLESVLNESHPAVVYPGSPQGLNIKETGRHGCYLVELDNGKPSLRWVGTSSVTFAQLPCDWSEVSSRRDGIEALIAAFAQLEGSLPEGALLVRWTLTGEKTPQALFDARTMDTIMSDAQQAALRKNGEPVFFDSTFVDERKETVNVVYEQTSNPFLQALNAQTIEPQEWEEILAKVFSLKKVDFASNPGVQEHLQSRYESRLNTLVGRSKELLWRDLMKGGDE